MKIQYQVVSLVRQFSEYDLSLISTEGIILGRSLAPDSFNTKLEAMEFIKNELSNDRITEYTILEVYSYEQ